jgi:hypothetical protein
MKSMSRTSFKMLYENFISLVTNIISDHTLLENEQLMNKSNMLSNISTLTLVYCVDIVSLLNMDNSLVK